MLEDKKSLSGSKQLQALHFHAFFFSNVQNEVNYLPQKRIKVLQICPI